MKTVRIFEAQTHFSALLEAVAAGETIGVARALFESGAIAIADDFDAPLPAEMTRRLHAR